MDLLTISPCMLLGENVPKAFLFNWTIWDWKGSQ